MTEQLSVTSHPTFRVTINSSAFQYKYSPLKERMQRQFIPHFWNKMKMDQKVISAGCEDRLSELTTRQIDRIIDMQKIKTLIHEQKRRHSEIFITPKTLINNQPAHNNTYQAHFLAKINQIAIKRNVRHQKSQAFDEYVGQQVHKGKNREKRLSNIGYKYIKQYRKRQPQHRVNPEDDDIKSIASIKDDLDGFEMILEQKMRANVKDKKGIINRKRILPKNRWFQGMSLEYIQEKKQVVSQSKNQLFRLKNYDIEAQVKDLYNKQKVLRNKIIVKSVDSTGISNSNRYLESFDKFKTCLVNFKQDKESSHRRITQGDY